MRRRQAERRREVHESQAVAPTASSTSSAVMVLGPAAVAVVMLLCFRGQRRRRTNLYAKRAEKSDGGKYSSPQGLTLRRGVDIESSGVLQCSPTGDGRDNVVFRRCADAAHNGASSFYASYAAGIASSPLSPPETPPATPVRQAHRRTQAVFDVDDTIKSSGNMNIFGYALGGVDAQYTRGVIYPGVAQFAFELSAHDLPLGEIPAPVAVLTARAKELGPALKLRGSHSVVKAFERAGKLNGYPGWGIGWDKGCVLYGSVAEWVRVDDRGLRKFDNFRNTLSCCAHPEVGGAERNKYILVGDTGEWDLHCGELMLENFSQDVAAVMMHCVSNTPDQTAVPHDATINDKPICFFKTYPGAARKAYLHGLISAQAMIRVCDAALAELEELEARCPHSSRWADLLRDIDLCKVLYATKQQHEHEHL